MLRYLKQHSFRSSLERKIGLRDCNFHKTYTILIYIEVVDNY